VTSRAAGPGWISPAVLGRAVRGVWREAVTRRVRDGQLHDFGWPVGLGALVAVGCGAAVMAAMLALASGPLRRSTDLVVAAPSAESLPRTWVWLLLTLLVVTAALFALAVLRGPWWLRLLGLLVVVQLMIIFGVRGLAPDERISTAVSAAAVLGLVVFAAVRSRSAFAWWEFCVLVGLIGIPLVAGLVQIGSDARALGFEFTPAYLARALTLAGALVLPLFVAAGFAIANLAVGLTLATLRQAQRLPGRSWPYAVLALFVAFRIGQSAWEVTGGRLAGDDWLTYLPALGVAAALGLVVAGLRWVGRHRDPVVVSDLAGHAERIAVPVSVALVGLLLPVLVVTAVQVLVSELSESFQPARFDAAVIATMGTDPASVLIAAVLLVLAVRQARAGAAAYALVLGCSAVVVLTLAMRFLTGHRWPIRLDVDALNLVATGVTLGVAAWYTARRSMSPDRALALAGLLILSALFSYRDLLTDPVGAVVGYTGAGLVLFGIAWDFLTGSAWGNRSSRAFPTPTRVLLLVVKLLLPAILIAFTALSRAPSAARDLDSYAGLGNLVLGTGLLAAAYIAVLQLVVRDRPLAATSAT
jgi:hypothetical protein